MRKISIIIPVYNVEKYIRQCLESVINQTYKNLEIIVVNDGTKDSSIKIVEEYLNDKRIKIINQNNQGLSSARNKGLNEANGEYVFFLDSDDWLEKDAIENLEKGLEKEIEIISANFYSYDEIKKVRNTNFLNLKYNQIENGKKLLLNELEIVVWNKLYNTSFLKKNNLFFLENIIHEDEHFTYECYMSAKQIKYINKITYNYRINREGSIMNEVEKNKERRNFSISSLKKIINKIKLFETDDYFIKVRTLLRVYKLKEKIFQIEKKELTKKELDIFENKLSKIKFEKLDKEEKKIIKEELQILIRKKYFRNINIFKIFFWKNGILNIKLLRKIISRKIRGI